MITLAPGVRFAEVDLGVANRSPGQWDKLYVYLPEGDHSTKSLPCVLIAPAGSNLVIGMTLSSNSQPEHLPYVQAGFAVVAYELDGHLENPDNSYVWDIRRAVDQFAASEYGLVNARNALTYISARVPEIDPDRIYTAGHSSAATMALVLAEHEPRIHGCIAYAPVTTLAHRFDDDSILRLLGPKARKIIDHWSPHMFSDRMNCPVMLFHSRADDVVSYSESTDFARLLQQHNKKVDLVLTNHGDHYESMIHEGIRKGIAWLALLDGHIDVEESPDIPAASGQDRIDETGDAWGGREVFPGRDSQPPIVGPPDLGGTPDSRDDRFPDGFSPPGMGPPATRPPVTRPPRHFGPGFKGR
ncbi:MAG: prolyl oligopeptidase family serine peptidase [Pirellulales bacterium]|nr:prolyl oligopeptidase family serine peptidase [Pirellulales bacterium]